MHLRVALRGGRILTALAAAIVAIGSSSAMAAINFNVTFDDPGAAFSSFYGQITSHTLAAGGAWASHLSGDASLEVVIRFNAGIPRATGRSLTSNFVGTNGAINVFEQGAAAEIRTGIDPNGLTPDIEFVFNPTYLANELWFDPDPVARTAAVDVNRTDAVSVFLHEFGHAFAINGFRNQFDGTLQGFESTFDEHTVFDGMNFFFVGSQAVSLYGQAVPLTFGNIFHLGNNMPRPGSDLIPDLMNGVVFFRGSRYDISPLDLAILADTGMAVVSAVPEPSSLVLLAIGGLGAVGFGWRKRTAKFAGASAQSGRAA